MTRLLHLLPLLLFVALPACTDYDDITASAPNRGGDKILIAPSIDNIGWDDQTRTDDTNGKRRSFDIPSSIPGDSMTLHIDEGLPWPEDDTPMTRSAAGVPCYTQDSLQDIGVYMWSYYNRYNDFLMENVRFKRTDDTYWDQAGNDNNYCWPPNINNNTSPWFVAYAPYISPEKSQELYGDTHGPIVPTGGTTPSACLSMDYVSYRGFECTDGKTDFLIGSWITSRQPNDNAAPINMCHALAAVKVQIGPGMDEGRRFTKIRFKNLYYKSRIATYCTNNAYNRIRLWSASNYATSINWSVDQTYGDVRDFSTEVFDVPTTDGDTITFADTNEALFYLLPQKFSTSQVYPPTLEVFYTEPGSTEEKSQSFRLSDRTIAAGRLTTFTLNAPFRSDFEITEDIQSYPFTLNLFSNYSRTFRRNGEYYKINGETFTMSSKNYIIDWGDGTDKTVCQSGQIQHTYTESGTYTIRIMCRHKKLGPFYWSVNYYPGNSQLESNNQYTIDVNNVGDVEYWSDRNYGTYAIGPSYLFYGLKKLTSIRSDLFDGNPNMETANGAFAYCSNITSVPTELFKNCPNVTSLYQCFSNTGLTEVPDAMQYLTNVESLWQTFYDTKITEIKKDDLKYNTKVTTLIGAFGSCNKLTKVDRYAFQTLTNVVNCSSIFANCINLSDIGENDTDGEEFHLFWNCTEANNFNQLFFRCSSLTYLSPKFFIKNTKAKNFGRVIMNCNKIESADGLLDIPGSPVTDISEAFAGCYKLKLSPKIFYGYNKDASGNFYNATMAQRFGNTTTPIDMSNCFVFAGLYRGSRKVTDQTQFSWTASGDSNDPGQVPDLWNVPYIKTTEGCFYGINIYATGFLNIPRHATYGWSGNNGDFTNLTGYDWCKPVKENSADANIWGWPSCGKNTSAWDFNMKLYKDLPGKPSYLPTY